MGAGLTVSGEGGANGSVLQVVPQPQHHPSTGRITRTTFT